MMVHLAHPPPPPTLPSHPIKLVSRSVWETVDFVARWQGAVSQVCWQTNRLLQHHLSRIYGSIESTLTKYKMFKNLVHSKHMNLVHIKDGT